jgi:hypothetical protein
MYRRIDVMKVLLVAVNTRGRAEAFVLTQACRVFQGNCPSALRFRVHGSGEWAPLSGERMEVPIPARDFRLIELAPVQSVEGEGGSLIRNPRLGRSS